MTGNKWADAVVIVAAVLTASGVVWAKGLKPLFRFGRTVAKAADQAVEAFPVLINVAESWDGMTVAVKELTEYTHHVAHRDANSLAVLQLRGHVTETAITSLTRDVTLLSDAVADVSARVKTGGLTTDRIEAAAAVVASDLAESHERADAVPHGDTPGEAADAASRTTPVPTKENP